MAIRAVLCTQLPNSIIQALPTTPRRPGPTATGASPQTLMQWPGPTLNPKCSLSSGVSRGPT